MHRTRQLFLTLLHISRLPTLCSALGAPPSWQCERDLNLYLASQNGSSSQVLHDICSSFPAPIAGSCSGGSLYIVAHPDDDLLFLSPDLSADLITKPPSICFTTVFLTSGDAGQSASYAMDRETGIRTAYANLITCDDGTNGTGSSWIHFVGGGPGLPNDVYYLACAPTFRIIFLRLPDGDYAGEGYASTNHETLRGLYNGTAGKISSLPFCDGSTAQYTFPKLKGALRGIIQAVSPSVVRTLDWEGDNRTPVDHADHYTTGKLVRDVMLDFGGISLIGYVGYAIAVWPKTMDQGSANFSRKELAFFEYAAWDEFECHSWQDCIDKGVGEPYWLLRQYHLEDAVA